MYVSDTSDVARNAKVQPALRRSRSRDGYLKSCRDTPCAIAALRLLDASPDLACAYRAAEASPSAAQIAQRATLRLAVFAIVAAECSLHFLASSRSAPRQHMGVSAKDFDHALASVWERVSGPATDGLFENSETGLPLGNQGRLRELAGLTAHHARARKITHHVLQMAVARSLLIRAIRRILSAFIAHAEDIAKHPRRSDSEKFLLALSEDLDISHGEIRRARSILDLLGAKDEWPVIIAICALCHVAARPAFEIDYLAKTFPLGYVSIRQTPKGMATAIRLAVARAGVAREFGVAARIAHEGERRSQAELRKNAGRSPVVATPVATAPDPLRSPARPQRVVASDLRAALRPIMRSMHEAGMELSASSVRYTLAKGPLPKVHVGTKVLATGIDQFQERLSTPGTKRGTMYHLVVRGEPLAYGYGAFNNTVYYLKWAIIKSGAPPG